nr:hypothetical protein [Lachnospiraceae bacterium]
MKKQNLLGRGIALVLCATVLGQTMSTNGVAVFAANKSEAVIQTDDTISDKNTIEENQGIGENDSTGEIKEISLECANYSSSLVELRWNVEDDFECSAFFIYRDGKKIDVLDKTDEAEYGYSDKNVEANKTYSYRIEAVNSEETKVAESAELYVEVLEDWNITGDTTLSQNKKVKNLTITKGTLNLSSYELQVEGTVTLSGEGKLNVNKGYLECNNLNVSRNYTYITMTDVNGYILVKNNMTYSSYSSSSISAGTLEIKGDFTYDSTGKGCFSCIGKHKTIFSGKKKQTIKFSDESSYFSIVELDNHSEDGVVSSGVLNAYELHTNGCKLDQGIEGGKSGWTLSDDETVDGDLILQSDELDLDGHTLRIKGDFIQPGGMVKINKGTLIVDGNYYIENKKNTDGADKFSRGSGILKMLDSEDRVVVKGNFRMGSLWKHESVIKAGTMEVGGDFKQTTYVNNGNFASTESFKLIMNGKGAQKIDFAQNEPSASRIANLEIQNDSEDGVTIGGNHVTVTGTITDNGHYVKGYVIPGASATITDNTYHGNLYLHVSRTIGFPLVVEGTVSQDTSITYNADVTIKGGYSLSNGYGYLSGHEMHVEGNVTISSNGYYHPTNLVLQGGKLICEGNLTVNPSYSYIIMNNANDYIYVGGNCSFTSSVCSTMSAGTLELKGDFTQKGSYSNVQASGSHKVVLSGDKKQTVLFENTSCHFHNLVLENYSEEGIYAPNGLN